MNQKRRKSHHHHPGGHWEIWGHFVAQKQPLFLADNNSKRQNPDKCKFWLKHFHSLLFLFLAKTETLLLKLTCFIRLPLLWLFSFFGDVVNSFFSFHKKFNLEHFSEPYAIFTQLFLIIMSFFHYPLFMKTQLKRTKNQNYYKNIRMYVKCCKIQNTIRKVHKKRLSIHPGNIIFSEFLKPSQISH